MTTSLLSLPDELLALVVDQALGEYAPRLYEERQQTACALALVNKRVGGIAQVKLLEAVHIALDSQYVQHGIDISAVHEPRRVRAMQVRGPGHNRLFNFTAFAFLQELRLVGVTYVSLDDVGQLPELRAFVLAHSTFGMSRPLAAVRLTRLVVYFCALGQGTSEPPFTAAGCPSLRHLFFGLLRDESPGPVDDSLLDQVDTLCVEMFDSSTDARGLTQVLTRGAVSKQALLEKTLFDLLSDEVGLSFDGVGDAKHLRIHAETEFSTHDSAPHAARFADLAYTLDTVFPSLETLYLPLALDTSHVMLHRDMRRAMTSLTDACALRRVEIVFEHALEADEPNEDRASPHFEARCRRIKAEQAAAASAAAQTAAASAAARR